MKELKFRLLKADEIECRVGTQAKDNSWVTLLLYKDARVDMRLLDETVGAFNWQRKHELIDGHLFCTVSIWDEEKSQWVSKQDVGTESNTEATKGEASDAAKRACFNWGIGRELYTAPFIYIKAADGDVNQYGKWSQKFDVQSIGYDDNGNINSLVIVDGQGRERYVMGQHKKAKPAPAQSQQDKVVAGLVAMTKACATMQDLTNLRNNNMAYANNQTFRDALNARASELKQNAA